MMKSRIIIFLLVSFLTTAANAQNSSFVKVKGHQFILKNRPYYYIGANYWYAGNLAIGKKKESIDRLKQELDFLSSKGVKNLRVVASTEGSGKIHGVDRISPALQTKKGVFDQAFLEGLDVLLAELNKRGMKAVLFLSNNWEWSGGFLQYLNWNGLLSDSTLRRKLSWDEMRDYVSKFYSCTPCKADYLKQLDVIVTRTNKITGKKYIEDQAIMAWELANEPRPMRPYANDAYAKWIKEVSAHIKSIDKNHLVTTGVEGQMGTENMALFESIHKDRNIDYLTIHIWPKNWSWFRDTAVQSSLPDVIKKTSDYVQKHVEIAGKLDKPLVLEEFGLPRDGHSFSPASSTNARDQFYESIFKLLAASKKENGPIVGANFWTFGGLIKPISGQAFWKNGDPYMGDPPMEEQGLNSVLWSDESTWTLINAYTLNLDETRNSNAPSDKLATKETINLYKNLRSLLNKGVMFGHQDDLAYGVDWKYVDGKSDVKELVGDYPAVYGWELGNIEHSMPYNLDSVPFDKMSSFIKEGYKRGGVITLSWHADNPVNGQSAWDITKGGVSSILPGGDRHALYKEWLDRVVAFLKPLKGQNGESIPILFRPFHELTGNWFWWCQNTCSPTEFKLLWRFTVDYLRNVNGLHNLLYVYNTADFFSKDEFKERYPGDDVVDLVSFDAYQHGDPAKDSSFYKGLTNKLDILEEMALEQNKIPALAETGFERIPYATWWTDVLWSAIEGHKISYVLAWRNHGLQANGNWHYYVPKKQDVSSEDFKKFYRLDKTLFQKEVTKENIYK